MADKPEATRLYEQIARDIAAWIEDGRYAIGERLPAERHLAQAYSVSRPTIREAMLALEIDGLVEVRMGSGVYVIARTPRSGAPAETDMGPFEILEARRAIEGEVCTLAAERIGEETLAELGRLMTVMEGDDVAQAEAADRQFHEAIARATENSAMLAAVTMLWDARERSLQYRLLAQKALTAGLAPSFDEHVHIVEALRAHDPVRARTAMRRHLSMVIEALLRVTEVHELEQARARVSATRKRYMPAEEGRPARPMRPRSRKGSKVHE
jgi:DNA-binding FadR family transcriptional regulator